MCSTHSSCHQPQYPRILHGVLTYSTTIYVNLYSVNILYLCLLMTSKFVLATFNNNLLTLNHYDKLCKSLLTTLVKDSIVLEDVYAVNSMTLVLRKELGRSFLYIKNSKGPRTEPQLIGILSDRALLHSIYCIRLDR